MLEASRIIHATPIGMPTLACQAALAFPSSSAPSLLYCLLQACFQNACSTCLPTHALRHSCSNKHLYNAALIGQCLIRLFCLPADVQVAGKDPVIAFFSLCTPSQPAAQCLTACSTSPLVCCVQVAGEEDVQYQRVLNSGEGLGGTAKSESNQASWGRESRRGKGQQLLQLLAGPQDRGLG